MSVEDISKVKGKWKLRAMEKQEQKQQLLFINRRKNLPGKERKREMEEMCEL